jgi:hypothetical protein
MAILRIRADGALPDDSVMQIGKQGRHGAATRAWLVVSAACFLAGILSGTASAAPPIHEVLARGQVSADFSYVKRASFGYRDAHISISRSGSSLVNRSVKLCRFCETWPLVPHHSLRIRDLDGDGEPEVILRLYSGGAHCCFYDRVFQYQTLTNSYASATKNWGDAGARLRDFHKDGLVDFRSADKRFFYRFTAFAFSLAPIQIWHFEAGRFEDVTRDGFRLQIRADKRQLWRAYLRHRSGEFSDVRGILAAWLADKYLLHRGAEGWHVLRRIEARGELTGEFGPTGKRYLKKLRHFLVRTGYAH